MSWMYEVMFGFVLSNLEADDRADALDEFG